MELSRALTVFRQYCWLLKRDRNKAESLLLTDAERQAIRDLIETIREYAGLFHDDLHEKVDRAA